MSRHERTFSAMGSSFYLCIDASIESAYATHLFNQLEARTAQLEQVMSRFRPDSELTYLNQHLNQPVVVSHTLREVLHLASLFMGLSSGAFDPRVLTSLDRFGYRGADIVKVDGPESTEHPSEVGEKEPSPLFETKQDSQEIWLHQTVDLGGIGKGYTSDVLADVIESAIPSDTLHGYIVDAGGDIVLSGQQESGVGWSVGVEDPFGGPGELAVALGLPYISERIAVCTSSLKRRSWSHQGRRVHHLIDPRTGQPAPTSLRAVTALGTSAAYTEVFTKCKMIAEGTNAYPWLGTPLPYVGLDEDEVLCYSQDIVPVVTWLSSKYKDAKVVP